ncbi:ABC transporter permease [Oceanobacillus polygoni]|uniref:ABC-2 type transport system permease protein n=1 Tax=Oceanobacillus polygoni TaxID=1235259 RepID=A0A9X1CAX3_9BACI|nr:ABC transporter permease [Oceanobacillus polygoni]MBP2076331.1 ABC-2 type transport system permease protein [Oceanobacillus polygoni]
MRNTMKVAKWEIKRNMKNKTFLIGLFLTPILILAFGFIGSLFGGSDDAEHSPTTVHVNDQTGIYPALEETINQSDLDWEMELTDIEETAVEPILETSDNTAILFINDQALETGIVPVYTSNEIDQFFINQVQVLTTPLQALKIEQFGLTEEETASLLQGITFEEITMEDAAASEETAEEAEAGLGADPMERIVPGIFAGIIMFSVIMTGMATFQSASQEKKDKIAEIILSSLTPSDLMQGKIVGYFVLGIIQVVVFFVVLLPFAVWKLDIPIMEYLLVPETLLLVFIAILSYLMFASIFVGIGATMSDITTAGNFQGFVMMLPFAPLVIMGPVFKDPSGIVAQVGTYIPFTAPGVLIMRLSTLEQWPWIEIIISLIVIMASVWIFMKLAGKIFKVGILMYGKNATPGEILKWLRA